MALLKMIGSEKRINVTLLTLTAAIAALTALAPPDAVLGSRVRVVYLHGAVVWTALIGYGVAGVLGLAGWLPGRERLLDWSQAVEWTAILFWALHLPLSLLSSGMTWNAMFFGEPRFILSVRLLLVALVFQGVAYLLRTPRLSASLNALMAGLLVWLLPQTRRVMHPDNPIGSSESAAIKLFYAGLVALCLLAAMQISRWLRARMASKDPIGQAAGTGKGDQP